MPHTILYPPWSILFGFIRGQHWFFQRGCLHPRVLESKSQLSSNTVSCVRQHIVAKADLDGNTIEASCCGIRGQITVQERVSLSILVHSTVLYSSPQILWVLRTTRPHVVYPYWRTATPGPALWTNFAAPGAYPRLGVAIMVLEMFVLFRSVIVGQLQYRRPRPFHPGICQRRIWWGQRPPFPWRQRLQKVQ